MRPFVSCIFGCALVLAFASSSTADDNPSWVTIKGRVVFPADKKLPVRATLNVNQDKKHCLSKNAILDESVLVNPKNRGIKNVVVYLRPNNVQPNAAFTPAQIHPSDAKRKPAEVVIDQPCCMFENRITCARVGDTLVVKNPAPVNHNFFWDSSNNGSFNVNIASRMQWKMPNALKAESPPIQYKCTIHGWMTGYVRIFNHPYFAITDEDGNFEIKNAPAGKFRIVYWHENGLRGGSAGRTGDVIQIQGKTLEMKPIDFDVSTK